MNQPNVISLEAAKEKRPLTLSDGSRKLVLACRSSVEQVIPRYMEAMLDKLDNLIFEVAGQVAESQIHESYYDALRAVHLQWGLFGERFGTSLVRRYNRFWQVERSPAADAASKLELELVAKEELEEKLAISSMVSKADSLYFKEIYLIDKRFSRVAGGMEVSVENNPLAPAAICESFQSALKELKLEISVRLIVYKLFDKVVMEHLDAVYDRVNKLLVQAGVLPNLKVESQPRPVTPPRRKPADKTGMEKLTAADRAVMEKYSPAELFGALRQLLSERASADQESGAPQVPTDEVIKALSNLQEAPTYEDEATTLSRGIDLRRTLAESLKLNGIAGQRVIGQLDQDTIDVVSMLFEFILGDRHIPDDIKVLLVRLQIPILKVAIMDREFFSSDQHPARSLLNTLARAAVSWTPGSDHSENSLYGKVESVINRILMEFEDDLSLFEKLDKEFATYLEREKIGVAMAEDRATKASKGKEKLQLVKQRVLQELDRRFRDSQEMPEVVAILLEDGWKDVLLLVGLSHGLESNEWRNAVKQMDRLLWSVKPETAQTHRKELLQLIPVLLRDLRDGLNNVSYNREKMEKLFKALQTCHIANIRGITDHAACKKIRSHTGFRVDAAWGEGLVAADKDAVPEDAIEYARDLPVGTWFDFTDGAGTRQRIKFCWRSELTDSCLFVDRKGEKALEVSLRELALMMDDGRMTLLAEADIPLMDRALTAIMDSLESGKSVAAG